MGGQSALHQQLLEYRSIIVWELAILHIELTIWPLYAVIAPSVGVGIICIRQSRQRREEQSVHRGNGRLLKDEGMLSTAVCSSKCRTLLWWRLIDTAAGGKNTNDENERRRSERAHPP